VPLPPRRRPRGRRLLAEPGAVDRNRRSGHRRPVHAGCRHSLRRSGHLGTMIDLHSHVLPGVDDGARTLEESLAILRAAAEDGIIRIAATPHVRADYPTSPDTMERGVAVLNRAAREAGVPIEVLAGGELDIEYA